MNALDIPRRLFPKRATIKATHAGYWREAPSIATTSYFRCDVVNRSESWCGEKTPQGAARCVPMPHVDAIMGEANRTGMPHDYKRDVYVHDRNSLAHVPPECPIVWVLRTCGSCIYLATSDAIDGTGETAWGILPKIVRTFGESNSLRFYTWDGSRLREHRSVETCADAVRELAAGYDGPRACWRPPHAPNNAWLKFHYMCPSVTGVQP